MSCTTRRASSCSSGTRSPKIRGDGRIASVVTRGGEERDADLLIAGIGVVPNTSFVEGAGIDVDDGVLVNPRFETSREGVYAVGDVARFHDPIFMRRRRIEHWSNANYQGGELGKVLAGEGHGYDTVSSFFSEIFGASIRFFGDSTGHDDVVQHGDFRDGQGGLPPHRRGPHRRRAHDGPGGRRERPDQRADPRPRRRPTTSRAAL